MASETPEDKKLDEEVATEEKEAAVEGDEEKVAEKDLIEEDVGKEGDQSERKEEPSEKAKGSRKRSYKKGGSAAAGESTKSEEESTPKKPRKRSSSSVEHVTPADRPSRERKSVERYSASSEKVPATKVLSIEQGRGVQLKDIPNVAFKLSKRKPDENLQILHTILFGKKAKVHVLKRNISQFSGYVWLQNEEKQRAKIKEKLDKFVKEKLFDFCDLLDVPFSKSNTRKEELSAKLLEFLESPHATTEVSLAEKEQKGKKRKRKSSAGTKIASGSVSDKKTKRSPEVTKKQKLVSKVEDEDEPGSAGTKGDSDDSDDNDRLQKEQSGASESEEDKTKEADEGASKSEEDERNESEEGASESEEDKTNKETESVKGISKNIKGSEAKGKAKATPTKRGTPTKSVKGPAKGSSSAQKKGAATADDDDRVSASPNKSKAAGINKQTKDDKRRAKQSSTPVKGESTSKSGAKVSVKQDKGKSKKAAVEPSREEMHVVVTAILKEVDFNTATLSDIIRQLGTRFGMDLMHKKTEVKGIIEDVITNMTDEEDDGENEEDDNNEQAEGEADKASEDNDD